ncbi:MAG: hypothetical protein IPG07_01645 [Crocinitomicaceae bacterium]|nr:hypothetical protein [Crocinitomicaceae bacterium]
MKKCRKLNCVLMSLRSLKNNLSKNGNYVSISIKQMMLNSEDILLRYERVSKIKNVIVL